MQTLLVIHSHTRWLILLVALVAIVKFTLGWLRGGAFKGMDRGLASGFSGLMDLQATLGLIFLIWTGLSGVGFPMLRIEHATTMIVAAVLAHLPARWKNASDTVRFRNTLFCIVGSLVLVFMGVVRLRGGWTW
ncbi:MAG: hypothetical protein IPG80_21735 [Anaerolineales bacterium]|jgi:uncharacterized membrane protein YphA (DoxX/SURF4 family)|uniref:hypothetical protein n=1 Tax=Candidatus Villigracilis vicinus TaxID=3140679 RepID=UPI003134D9C9|nr:hypothetical protein [Anaerolineales bacterium]MBK9779745.1 hypothetical protein [Anaerolineales bacterium]